MSIELKVSLHPSGNRTLMARHAGAGTWADVLSPAGVFANSDPITFYRVTADYIAELSREGKKVYFQDTREG